MTQPVPAPRHQPTEVGALLRYWRTMRGKSQLDLALEAGLSQRHMSFVESGRSTPSRHKLLAIAGALEVPFRERNTLLLAAGYAPIYAEQPQDAPEMESVDRALRRMPKQHEPYPSVVMDRYWNVALTNDAAPRFFGAFIDLQAQRQPRNMLHLMFSPTGMRPYIVDWPEVARSLIARVRREAVGRVLDDRTQALIGELEAYPNVSSEWSRIGSAVVADASPIVPLSFARDDQILRYFSIVSVVATPRTVTAQELRVESLFPADARTEELHTQLMDSLPR